MQIHLCKPGGQREGPYSLEQINAALAARKYTGSDYWAWHQGLAEWVPLYLVSGVLDKPAATAPPSPPAPAAAGTKPQPAAEPASTELKPQAAVPFAAEVPVQAAPPAATTAAVATEDAEKADESSDSEKFPSGMPFAALDHSFLLTSGDGPVALNSEVMQLLLQRIIGEDIAVIRPRVPRDVIGRCNILEGLKGQSSTPPVVWKKMAELRPGLLQQARDGIYRICVRSFSIENGDRVSLFLFYNKQKL